MSELPFWLSLLFWSLWPATKTSWLEIASIPVSSKDLVLIVVTGVYLLPVINYRSITTFHKPWHYHLPIFTTFLLCYAARSVGWSGMELLDTTAMIYTLILTFSGFLLSYNLIAKMPSKSVRPFLWRLTVFLAMLGLVYSAESFFSLGLRSEVTKEWTDFGIERVRGPLFVSSTGYFILIPALAFAVQEMIQERVQRLFKLTVVISLMITILSLGSRAGLLLLCIFFVFLLLFTKDRKQRVFAVTLMIVITTIVAILVFSQAKSERLISLEDTARSGTYLTAWEIINNRSAALNILGSGYGSYWPWYLVDVEGGWTVYELVKTPFGSILYHPHSTLLLLVVELGFPGLLYFFKLLSVLFQILFRNLRGGPAPIFTCGVAASGFSLFFDLFIFKSPQIYVLWSIFFLGALALPVIQANTSCQIPVLSKKHLKTISSYNSASSKWLPKD